MTPATDSRTQALRIAIRRRPSGVLAVIAALLLTSGAIRIGLGMDAAFATAAEGEATEISGTCEGSAPTEALLEAFELREARLREREAQLADRMQALRLAEAEIDEKLAALGEAERTLADTLSIAESAAEDDIQRLTAVYEAMKPQDAAAVFTEMAPEFSAGFLARMDPVAAADVMTELAPPVAHTISVLIAGRNAAAPRE